MDIMYVYKSLMRGNEEECVQWQEKRQWAQVETHCFIWTQENRHFFLKSGYRLARISQKGSKVSLFVCREIPCVTGRGPEQSVVVDLLWVEWLDWFICTSPNQHNRFCYFIKRKKNLFLAYVYGMIYCCNH